jgi:hypothetical protein
MKKRLGFDHEHSRHDRDKNIKVIMDNILDSSNYRVNSKNPIYIDVPYDFIENFSFRILQFVNVFVILKL